MIKHDIHDMLLVLAVLIPFQSQAEISASECHPLRVYFGNGILTEKVDGFFEADRIDRWLRPRIPATDKKHVSFDLAYNPSDGYWTDLIEAFDQLVPSAPEKWDGFFPATIGMQIQRGIETLFENHLNSVGGRILAAVSRRLLTPGLYDDKTVQDLVRTYTKSLRSGERLLIVAYSQGNLYANAVYNHMRARQPPGINLAAIGIAAIGSPANTVATGDGYVNSATDLVLRAVRAIGFDGLPANDTSVPVFPAEDRLGHGFRDVYFNSRYTIRQHTQDVILATLNRVMNQPATRPVDLDIDGLAATAPFEGANLTNQFATSGMVFRGMKLYRNDGDPNNPITSFEIPMPPGRKGIAAGAIPSSEVKIDSEFRIGRIRLKMLSGATTVVATQTSGRYVVLNLSGLSGGSPEIRDHVMNVYSCNPADRVERVTFQSDQGYILYNLTFEAP